jgi:hypothetical protein
MRESIATRTVLIALLVFETGCGPKKSNENPDRAMEASTDHLAEGTKWDANVKTVKTDTLSQASAESTASQNFSPESSGLVGEIAGDSTRNRTYTTKLSPDSELLAKSDRGNYVLMGTILRRVEINKHAGLTRFQLVDSRGKVYWWKDEVLEYEGDSWGYRLANNGSSVRVNSTQGLLKFLDRDGNQIAEVDIFAEKIWSRGRSIYGKYSPDSHYFAANVSDDVGHTFPTPYRSRRHRITRRD